MKISKRIQLTLTSLTLAICSPVFAVQQESDKEMLAPFSVIETFTKAKPNKKQYLEDLSSTEWVNPTPSYTEIGLSKNDLIKLVGNRTIVIPQTPIEITFPYFGQLMKWHQAHFSTTMTKVPLNAEEMRQMIIDNDKYNRWKAYYPSIKKTQVVHNLGSDLMIREKYHLEVSFFDANGDNYIKNTFEDNGDITTHSLTSSFGISVGLVPVVPKAVLSPLKSASMTRWEFIDISEKESLLVRTSWGEIVDKEALQDFAKEQKKQNKTPARTPAAFEEGYKLPNLQINLGFGVYIDQFKQALIKQQTSTVNDSLSEHANRAPFEDLPASIEKLMRNGPIYFIHNKTQSDEQQSIQYATTLTTSKYKSELIKPWAAKMYLFENYTPDLDASELMDGEAHYPLFKQGEGASPYQVRFSTTAAKNAPVISAFKVTTTLEFTWDNPMQLSYQSVDGDIGHISGSVEWLDLKEDNENFASIMAYTTAVQLGEKPKFPINLAKSIPSIDIATSLIASAGSALSHIHWIEWEIERNTTDSQ